VIGISLARVEKKSGGWVMVNFRSDSPKQKRGADLDSFRCARAVHALHNAW